RAIDACAAPPTRPAPAHAVRNSRSIPCQVSEFAPFFVSSERPITARKQRNNSSGTAEDPKHFGPNSILFGSDWPRVVVLYLFFQAPMSSPLPPGLQPAYAPGYGAAASAAQRRRRPFAGLRSNG